MSAFFESRGLAFHVTDAGSGVPVVFQHGLCGDAAQPAEVFPFDLPARCLTLECRGHGRSQAGDPDAFSIAAFAEDVAAWADSLALGPLVFGGISMGAAIALRLAVTRPDLVRALVLARPAWIAEAGPDNMKPNAVVGELIARHEPGEARRRFEALDLVAELEANAPDNLNSLRGFFAPEPLAVTSALLTRIAADGPGVTRADIAALKLPALVIGSGGDLIHPFDHAQTLAALIPGARLVRITPKGESRAHYRRDFSAALAQFISETSP